ncbi:hypothetical protein SAMN05444672_13122 [Bacillus sp. OK838]|nr:hypothetical protein SAMN05444672_13122 [Bacillus sp. OK838]
MKTTFIMRWNIIYRLALDCITREIQLNCMDYCVYIDPVTKELSIQKKDSSFKRIKFNEIIKVIVED